MPSLSSQPSYTHLLPPDVIGRIGKLEFLARGAMEGFISGKHRSPHKGASVEFAEHREYVPGDEIRNMDWRVYGRSDRYYIKEYIEETNLRATLLLDASGSMKYTGEAAAPMEGKPLSKFEYGRYLAAALSYLFISQQDGVGLVTFDSEIRKYLPAKAMRSQVRLILEELEKTEPGAETGLIEVFHEIAERIHRRGMVIIISDLFDDAEQILKTLHHFSFKHHEVILFHVMAEEEFTFPFSDSIDFRDLEPTDQTLRIDPRTIRADYLDRINNFINEIERGCGRLKVDYVPMSTRIPFDTALVNYLSHRKSLAN